MSIFNRKLLKNKKNLIAGNFHNYNFLRQELASRLLEKLAEIKQDFNLGLDIGSNLGEISNFIPKGKIVKLIATDYSFNMLNHNNNTLKINADDENLPFKVNSFDVVISVMSLHNINKLSETIKKIYAVLKPSGTFLMCNLIEGTLDTLSQAIVETELEVYGGISNRVHPFSDTKTLGNLIFSAGFTEIVADSDKVEIMYKTIPNIFKDLRGMGETNILNKQSSKLLNKKFKETLEKNLEKIKDTQSNCYPININFCNIIGWK